MAVLVLLGVAMPVELAFATPETNQTERVIDALDLSRPELAAVAAAWKKKDVAATEKEFAAYLRNRKSVQWGSWTDGSASRPLSADRKKIADDAAEGKLQGGLVPLIYAFPEGKVDWHFNATEHVAGQTPNYEWQWQLNRMDFWTTMAAAYRVTNDEKYAQAFVQQMRSWVEQCPVPNHTDNVAGSSWRTIEAGIRTSWKWPEAYFAFVRSPSMSDHDLIVFVGSFLDHARYLRTFNTRLNYLTMEMSGLYAVGSIFPEFKEAADWRTFAAKKLGEETQNQFLPEGAQKELSTGYQNVSLINFLRVLDIARWNGRESELPPGYLAALEKAYDWQVRIMAPDRLLPKVNNSWPMTAEAIFKTACRYFPERSDFRWFLTDGKEGNAPTYTSIFLDRSGFAIMRSGWEKNANYLLFRMGPLGMGHQHQDGLGVILWAYGREILFNGGGGSYENSKWREWATSTYAHNCVIVDGMAQTRTMKWNDPFNDHNMVSQTAIDGHWISTPVYDFVSGSYDYGYGKDHVRVASQQRDVLYLKPDFYIVADRLRPADELPHRYQARWQIITPHTRIDPKGVLVTEDPGVSNLVIAPLLKEKLEVTSASGQEQPELLGWNVRKDVKPQNIPSTTLLHTRSGEGRQTLMTLFVPLQSGQENPIASIQPGSDGVSATVVLSDSRRLWISCAGERGIVVKEILASGQTGRQAQPEGH